MGSPLPNWVLNGSPSSPNTSTRYSRTSGSIVRSLRNAIWLNQQRWPVTGWHTTVLPGAQPALGLPLEPDAVGKAIALDRAAVVGAERVGDGRPDVLVVVAD